MKFTLETSNGNVSEYEGSFRVADSGVLTITPKGGNPILLSPAAWLSLEVSDAPRGSGDSHIHLA
jgi:hypothetical protein